MPYLRSILLSSVLSLLAVVVHAQNQAENRPNVVIIIVDDLGYADIGVHGATDIRTPNIDALANSGVLFRDGHVTGHVCAPSRAGLLSGRYQQRWGFETNPSVRNGFPGASPDPSGLTDDIVLLPKLLKEFGYRTALVGKWHLGDLEDEVPTRHGFDYFYGILNWGHFFLPPTIETLARGGDPWFQSYKKFFPAAHPVMLKIGLSPIYENTKEVPHDQYLTDALTDRAVRFIEETAGSEPFFLYLAHLAPHAPVEATQEYLDRYPDLSDEYRRRTYAAMVSAVDDSVGAVVDVLERKGVRDNTLVFFLSDNGGPSYFPLTEELAKEISWRWVNNSEFLEQFPFSSIPAGLLTQELIGGNGSNNLPLKGGKGTYYQGGIQIPYIVSYPRGLPHGKTSDATVSSLDIFPTILEAAGINAADKGLELDGISLFPIAERGADAVGERTLYWRSFELWAIRKGDWKVLQHGKENPIRLFNLASDPYEENDLALERPETVERLVADFRAWEGTLAKPAYNPSGSIRTRP